ncbi:MAG: flagellar export protein FliJ [Clostridiales bacterium]|nr:flagellar export protein FliJ [Clostridiales bacterium]
MGKFQFRLQGYLDLKEKMEDQRKMEYGQAAAVLEREKQKLTRFEKERQTSLDTLRVKLQAGGAGFAPDEITRTQGYLDLARNKIARQEEQVRLAAAETEKKRLDLVEAVKDRKTLEKLKDKAREEFLREEQLAEQKIVDEIVSYAYNDS